MTTQPENELIVVGLDGSRAADDAAGWAAAEADRRHAEVRLVHAYWLPATAGYPDYPLPADTGPALRAAGQRMLDRTAEQLRLTHPGLRVSTCTHHDRAVTALRHESERALLTVVGVGNESRITGVLLGSVALAIASTNPAPVAVIHPGHHPTTGPVVVGVDGSPTSDAAVAFAFEAASVRHTNLIAVHAWSDLSAQRAYRVPPMMMDPSKIEEEETALLSERIAGWGEKYPEVPVHQVVVESRAVTTLLDHASNAQLLVVGSHGRGGFTGMLLGSTSHSLIINSSCPVVVVRPRTRD